MISDISKTECARLASVAMNIGTVALANAERLHLHPQKNDQLLLDLANAVETLLRENADLNTAAQNSITLGERTADKLTLAHRRIEKLRVAVVAIANRGIHPVVVLDADDALAAMKREYPPPITCPKCGQQHGQGKCGATRIVGSQQK